VQEGTRFEPSVPLAVKTLLGHAFRRPTLCGSNPGGHGGGCWRYELYLCVIKIWRRVCRGERAGQQCAQRDVVILRSMPGLGRIILAVLLGEVWQPLRRRDYHALRSLSGVAPVTRRSGKTCVVVRRYACNKRLANALYHWARLATQHDALSRRRYAALRQRGHSHGRALRTIADHLLSVACTLLERQTLFDPATRFATPPAHEHPPPIPLFDRSGHPFVPTCFLAERRAQRQSRMPARMRRHRWSRRRLLLPVRLPPEMDSPVEGAGFKLPVPRKKGEGFETAFRVAARSNNKNGPDADRSVQGALPLPRQLRGRRHPSFDDIGDRARDRRSG